MIYQVALAVTVIVLIFSLLWGGGVYFEREEAREEAKDLRGDFKEVSESRDRWKARVVEVEKELVAYKKAKAENDERFMTERDTARGERDSLKASYQEALCQITDLDNLVRRIENAPLPEEVKGSYRITAIRGPYKKTRERMARRAARAGRRGATA